jgi:hypothetical protein
VLGRTQKGTYSYPSAIGMAQYIQGHTQPDITFSVSQCSRYTHSPKRSHERALERIGLYLKCTKNKGLILHPIHSDDGEFKIDCYVDANFAGLVDDSPIKLFLENCSMLTLPLNLILNMPSLRLMQSLQPLQYNCLKGVALYL